MYFAEHITFLCLFPSYRGGTPMQRVGILAQEEDWKFHA